MRLFHATSEASAAGIRDHGFRDGAGAFMTATTFSGVWLSDTVLGPSEGAKGDYVIVLEGPEHEVADFEWIEEGKLYREFLVPARVVNGFRIERIVSSLDFPDD